MRFRLLLDPTAEGGTPAPDNAQPKGSDGASTGITPDQVREMVAEALKNAQTSGQDQGPVSIARDRLAALEKLEADAAKQAKQLEDEMKAKGEYEKLLGNANRDRESEKVTLSAKIAELEKQRDQTAIGQALAEAIAGQKWVSNEAAQQFLSLISSQFHVTETNGARFVVRKSDSQPIGAVIKAALESSAYSHFLTSNAQPGAKTGNTAAGSTETKTPIFQSTPGSKFVPAITNRAK